MDLQKVYDNIGTLCTIIAVIPIIKRFLNSKPILTFLEDLRLKLSPYAFMVGAFVSKNKVYFNFSFKLIGEVSFALCITGATCVYLIGAKASAVLIFITLGLVLRWFYGKLLIIS